MTDKDFINGFKEIKITKICEEVGVNYHNITCGRAGYEATKKVANNIAKKLYDLLNKKGDFNVVDIDFKK